MFRELTRKHSQLDESECIAVLTNEKRGVLSVNGDGGYPYGMPMNHYYSADDGCIYFHCGLEGHRLDSLRKSDKVSFCVYDEGVRKDGHWAYRIKSVIVFGRMEIIDDKDIITDIVTKLCYKFTDDDEYIRREFEGALDRTLLLKLVPENICGKRVTEA